MRLGVIAALVFIVLSLGIWYSAVTNVALIDADTEAAMEQMSSAYVIAQEGEFGAGNFITMVGSTFGYFGALIEDLTYQMFNNPLWVSGGWTLVPYFTLSPFVIVLIFGLILLMLGMLQKQV